jgi:hypothetical protein
VRTGIKLRHCGRNLISTNSLTVRPAPLHDFAIVSPFWRGRLLAQAAPPQQPPTAARSKAGALSLSRIELEPRRRQGQRRRRACGGDGVEEEAEGVDHGWEACGYAAAHERRGNGGREQTGA